VGWGGTVHGRKRTPACSAFAVFVGSVQRVANEKYNPNLA
jgi:hypothetical protein